MVRKCESPWICKVGVLEKRGCQTGGERGTERDGFGFFSRKKKKKTKDNLCGPVCFVVLI
jgi:hypothetical protein